MGSRTEVILKQSWETLTKADNKQRMAANYDPEDGFEEVMPEALTAEATVDYITKVAMLTAALTKQWAAVDSLR